MKSLLRPAICVVVGMLVVGCSGEDPRSPNSESAKGNMTARSGTSQAQVLTSWYSGGEVTTTVHPIEVVDDHAVVVLDFALDPGGEMFRLDISLERDPDHKGSGGVRLVDLENDRVWTAGYDAESVPAATRDFHYLKPGESITTVTMFAAPETEQVDVLVPGVGLVWDVPVVKGGADTPAVASLDLTGEVRFPGAAQLGTYTQSYLDGASVSGHGEKQTVTLASDVLFDTDKYDLTPEATKVVDEAAAAIKASGAEGEVQVVGHTDDVASQEYNLKLSVNRAQTVAGRLTNDLGDAYTIVSEGKGKLQPAVPGTSAEARAANRRVEISFTATKPAAFEGSTIPEAQVPVSTGNEPVEYQHQESGQTIAITVAKVVRSDGYLVGTLNASLVKDDSNGNGLNYGVRRWFGDGHYVGNINVQDWANGAWPVYLLTDGGKVFAAQYRSDWEQPMWGGDETVSFLADRHTVNKAPLGRTFTYDVIWPDPGTDTISVEARDSFRITDIPVEDE